MDLNLSVEAIAEQSVRVSPRLVAASYILELSSQELHQVIQQELEENPAMELLEAPTCPTCGGAIQGRICPHCLSPVPETKNTEAETESAELYDDYLPSQNLAAGAADDDFDPMTQVAAQMTLNEYLLRELQAIVPRVDVPIAEYLVGNLDDNGYLCTSVEEAGDFLDRDVADVERVLAQLQTLEPVGIGARDLRECLLIQLDYLERQGVTNPYARRIVEHHLKQLGEHKFGRIAQELGTTPEAIAEACAFIKERLNPFPGHEWGVPDGRPAGPASNYVMPDVIIQKRDGGFEVEVVESKRFILRVAPMYHQLASSLARDSARLSEDERRHIQQYVSRAKLFIANINQRRQTLHKITACIIETQRAFLEGGVRHLRPLTRAAVAERLGLHESTVSRATAGKFVMLPVGKVIPFSDFFTASLSVKDVIKEIIENEERPLTDQEIAERLAERGITVARRTVAKYREQLGILPSSLR